MGPEEGQATLIEVWPYWLIIGVDRDIDYQVHAGVYYVSP